MEFKEKWGSEVNSSHDRGSHILRWGLRGSGACNQKGGGDHTISYTPVRLEHGEVKEGHHAICLLTGFSKNTVAKLPGDSSLCQHLNKVTRYVQCV